MEHIKNLRTCNYRIGDERIDIVFVIYENKEWVIKIKDEKKR
jgi:hypothetical protein